MGKEKLGEILLHQAADASIEQSCPTGVPTIFRIIIHSNETLLLFDNVIVLGQWDQLLTRPITMSLR